MYRGASIYKAHSLDLKTEQLDTVLCPAFVEVRSQRLSRWAAEVLAMLETRSSTILSDRLAIVVNLCAYERRLDIAVLESHPHGFSIAMLGFFADQWCYGTTEQIRRTGRELGDTHWAHETSAHSDIL